MKMKILFPVFAVCAGMFVSTSEAAIIATYFAINPGIPSLNEQDQVAFRGGTNDYRNEVYRSGINFGSLETVFSASNSIEVSREFVSINDLGDIAFTAQHTSDQIRFYRALAGQAGQQFATASASFGGSVGRQAINNSGVVVYTKKDATNLHINTFDGTANALVYSTNALTNASPSINDDGVILMDLTPMNINPQTVPLYMIAPGGSPVAVTNTAAKWDVVSINSLGQTAYSDGSLAWNSIYLASLDAPPQLIYSNPDFQIYSTVINDVGQVAFRAYDFNTDRTGIYVLNPGETDPILIAEQGMDLFGRTADELVFSAGGFNNKGHLALRFSLSDNVSGVIVVESMTVPELSTGLMASIAFAGYMLRAYRGFRCSRMGLAYTMNT